MASTGIRRRSNRLARRQYGLVAAMVVVVFCLACRPGRAQQVALTAEEQAYVQNHGPVRLCVDPDWVPFESINSQGEHEGIAADLLRLVSERTGVTFRLVPTTDWDESLEASKDGRCQVLSFLNETPARNEWLLFTAPVFNDSNVFITREEHPFIDDPAGLTGESIVFPRGTSMEERVRSEYPNLRIVTTDSEMDALNMVSDRKADMTMRSLIIAAYTIKKEGLFNLKIAGRLPNYANNLRLGVVRSEPVLRGILDKGVVSITPQERGRIVNEHVAINVQTGLDKALALKIGLAFALVAGLGFAWNYKLKKYNAELMRLSRTDLLTDLPNRRQVMDRLDEELQRATRYHRPFAVIILDIDHFKSVNDRLGHQGGDRFLVAFGRILREAVRSCDLAGRIGGEEFLVLCPETDLEQAVQLAERIRAAVAAYDFEPGRHHSISAGVAAHLPGESADALLARADAALYRCKEGGRNKVCVL
ncbi:MAG: diguanylate cyclase [Solidesulfovibrio sp. DCME]|uniref:diguanylate cyclase n=1 Tax=Solidesulfovibrio sp. DCME TaxID=3447380 RepID=UPI003D0A544C